MEHDRIADLLAQNLQSLMNEKRLNASAWAKSSGLGHTAVRDIIQKKVKNPTYSTLLRLAATAGVDVRRITVGPDYQQIDNQDAEIVDLTHRLPPDLRQKLIAYGEGLLDGLDQPQKQSDADD